METHPRSNRDYSSSAQENRDKTDREDRRTIYVGCDNASGFSSEGARRRTRHRAEESATRSKGNARDVRRQKVLSEGHALSSGEEKKNDQRKMRPRTNALAGAQGSYSGGN